MKKQRNIFGILGFWLTFTGVVSYGLSGFFTAILCMLGLRSKYRGRRKLAITGLILSCLWVLLFFGILIEFTPPGTMPYPLNLYKYKKACHSGFWIDFDRPNIVKAQSRHYIPFITFGNFGSIQFETTQQGKYTAEDIVAYAEKNGWVYHGRLHLARKDFENNFEDFVKIGGKGLYQSMDFSLGSFPLPFWINEDCTAVGFDTGNHQGRPSYVYITDDGRKVLVRAYNIIVAIDPAYEFEVPPEFVK